MNNLKDYGLKTTENIWEWGLTHSNEFKTALHENCSLVFERLKSNLAETEHMTSEEIKKVLGQLKKSTKLLDEYYLIYLKFLSSTNFTSLQKHPVLQACERGGPFLDAIPRLLDKNSQGLKFSDVDAILKKAIKFKKSEIIKALHKHKLIDDEKLNEFRQNFLIIRKSPLDLPIDLNKLDKLCTPEKLNQLTHNLEEVIEHYPRYTLGNDFSVYNQTPADWNPKQIRLELKELQKKLLQTSILDEKKQEILLSNIQTIIDGLKPKTPVSLSIIIEKIGESEPVMLKNAEVSIYKGLPTLITMGLYESHPKEFEELFKKNDLQVYYQEKGNKERIMLVLPKGTQAESLGFALSDPSGSGKDKNFLKPWLGKDIADKKFASSFNENLQQIFLPDQENLGFHRIISVRGHGSSSGSIVGLKVKNEIQEFLTVLKNYHTVFLSLSSCNLGANSTKLGLRNGEIPYLIYVESSTDVSSFGQRLKNSLIYDEGSINLDSIQSLLFPDKYEEGKVYKPPKPLSNKIISSCVKFSKTQDERTFSNLGTIFQPTPAGVPRVAHTVSESPLILDISEALKKVKNSRGKLSIGEKNFEINECDVEKIAYMFSEPVIPATINIKGGTLKAFLSRGGNAHHIINEIIAPDLQIEDFGIATFNAFAKDNNDYEKNIKKAFFIGKLKCQYKGELVELKSVMICINGNKRKIIFKHGESYFEIEFLKIKKGKFKIWRPQEEKDLSAVDAIYQIYKGAAISQPSSKALLQVTAGKISDQDFYEVLKEQFWGALPRLEVQLYQAILNNAPVFRKEEDSKNEKVDLKHSSDLEKLLEILDRRNDKIVLLQNMLTLWKTHKKNLKLHEEVINKLSLPLLISCQIMNSQELDRAGIDSTIPNLIKDNRVDAIIKLIQIRFSRSQNKSLDQAKLLNLHRENILPSGLYRHELDTIDKYVYQNYSRLIAKVRKLQEPLTIKKEESGLSRTLQINLNGHIYILLKTKEKQLIGQGESKKVKTALDMSEDLEVASYTLPSENKELINILSFVSEEQKKFDGKGVAKILSCSSTPSKQGRNKTHVLAKYYSGGDLKRVLSKNLMTSDEKKSICLNIFKGVRFLHGLGLSHLDIHSGNIFLDAKRKKGVLGDLDALVRIYKKDVNENLQPPTSINVWKSPPEILEQLDQMNPQNPGLVVTEKTDVWMMGLLLGEVFNQNIPFAKIESKNIRDHLKSIHSKIWTEPENKNSLEHLIWLMLRPNPDERISLEEAKELFKNLDSSTFATKTFIPKSE